MQKAEVAVLETLLCWNSFSIEENDEDIIWDPVNLRDRGAKKSKNG